MTTRLDLWDGKRGAGGISWADRARMGPLRGVMDAADNLGRRNAYMHLLHKKVVQRELNVVPCAPRALDFGCGTGRFLSTLAARFDEVYAVDREVAMLESARKYAGPFVKELVCWQDNRVPFQSNFFDFVLCSSVLGVTSTELFDLSIFEMSRICKRGARLLLLEQVADRRNLPLHRYRAALVKAGFAVVRAYPIRSGVSVLTSLITRKQWIPERCFGMLASLEIAATSSGLHRNAGPYIEYAIVARCV